MKITIISAAVFLLTTLLVAYLFSLCLPSEEEIRIAKEVVETQKRIELENY